jgi:hypothetical protein
MRTKLLVGYGLLSVSVLFIGCVVTTERPADSTPPAPASVAPPAPTTPAPAPVGGAAGSNALRQRNGRPTRAGWPAAEAAVAPEG